LPCKVTATFIKKQSAFFSVLLNQGINQPEQELQALDTRLVRDSGLTIQTLVPKFIDLEAAQNFLKRFNFQMKII